MFSRANLMSNSGGGGGGQFTAEYHSENDSKKPYFLAYI